MTLKKIFIKKIIPLLLISVICIPFISCKPKNEFICENEDVGEAWKKYVLNYEENVDLLNIYPPTDYNSASSIINLERYKISDKETLDWIMPILMEIGEYSTKIGNLEETLKGIYSGKISVKCHISFDSSDPQKNFAVKLCDNLIVVSTFNSTVCFVAKENISKLGDEIMQIAKDNGVYTTDIG